MHGEKTLRIREFFRNKRISRKMNFFFNLVIAGLIFSIILLHSVGLRNFFKAPVNLMHMIVTYQEMYRIRYALDHYYEQAGYYPHQRDFHNFLYELGAQKAVRFRTDTWGNEYIYLPDIYDDRIVLVSKGPRGIGGTKDDVRLIWPKRGENGEKTTKAH